MGRGFLRSAFRESKVNILFVADPLESFKIYKDTTFVMMRELQRRGHVISACEPRDISWQSGGVVTANVRQIVLTGKSDAWFESQPSANHVLRDFDAVLMRKDPPFDSEYFYATHLLQQAEREGACVLNKPAALRITQRSWPSWSSAVDRPNPGHSRCCRDPALSCRTWRRDPQAPGWHGWHGHLPCWA